MKIWTNISLTELSTILWKKIQYNKHSSSEFAKFMKFDSFIMLFKQTEPE